jgi:aspartyl-tRNA(Asn)/glutamyl-tRNA(Gln) amidotransferase subunit C
MTISGLEIEKLFGLSKIKPDPKRVEEFRRKLSLVFDMIEQISKVDCSDVPPMVVISQQSDSVRDDVVVKLNSTEDLFANLPDSERESALASGHYRVPRVLEE